MVACWFALTFVERPALCHAHHVQENVKTVVYTVNARNNVANPVISVKRIVRGSVITTSVLSRVVSYATGLGATSLARRSYSVEVAVVSTFAVACAMSRVYVESAT